MKKHLTKENLIRVIGLVMIGIGSILPVTLFQIYDVKFEANFLILTGTITFVAPFITNLAKIYRGKK